MNLSQYRKPSSDKNNLISNKTKQYLKKKYNKVTVTKKKMENKKLSISKIPLIVYMKNCLTKYLVNAFDSILPI